MTTIKQTQTAKIAEDIERLTVIASSEGFAMALPTGFDEMPYTDQLQAIVNAYDTLINNYAMDKSEYSQVVL